MGLIKRIELRLPIILACLETDGKRRRQSHVDATTSQRQIQTVRAVNVSITLSMFSLDA